MYEGPTEDRLGELGSLFKNYYYYYYYKEPQQLIIFPSSTYMNINIDPSSLYSFQHQRESEVAAQESIT